METKTKELYATTKERFFELNSKITVQIKMYCFIGFWILSPVAIFMAK